MKLTHLKISEFMGIKAADMALSKPINIFAGPNESGKTSLRDATLWLLTGNARGLKNEEARGDLIRAGAKAAEVAITFEENGSGPLECSRRKTAKSPSVVSGMMPAPVDCLPLPVLMDTHAFFQMDEGTRRALLFKLIPGMNPTAKDLGKRAGAWLKSASVQPTQEFQFGLKKLINQAVRDGFKGAEAEAITRRREAKRARDVNAEYAQAPAQEITINETVFILPDVDKGALEITLKTLQARRDDLLRVAGRNEGLDEQVRETEAALANLIPVEPPDLDRPVEDWVKALEINKGILEKLQKKVVEMTAGQEPRLWPTTCPVHEIPCPSAGKMAIEGTKPKGGNPEAMVKAQADLTEQENEVGLIEADLKAAKSVQAAYDGYCKQRDRLDAQVKELKAQQGGGGNGHAAENLARLEAEINNQTVLQNAINDFWADKDKADRARVMVEKCEVEAIFYDVLQKALAPAGIPSQMLSEALAPVNNLLAVAAAHLFPGRTLTLTPELNFSLEGAPILSKSAELRVGVAIQYVLAKLAGARLLMVDEVDMLDPGNRMNFIKFLLAVKADFDTVMAFTTAASASPAPVPDIGMWWVSGGGVAPLN